MKGTTDATTPGGTPSRRGLFRRSRRSDDTASAEAAVATVDDLARRMEALAGDGRSIADDPVRAEFELQRAVIARANDLAAAAAHAAPGEIAPAPTTIATSNDDAYTTALEAQMQQPTTPAQDQPVQTHDDIEARLDAALQQPIPDGVPEAMTPIAPVANPAPGDAVLAPVVQSSNAGGAPVAVTSGQDAASSIGIDVDRVVRLIEEEALGVQHRIELELRAAHARAEEIVDRAEGEAEQIREHGQAQARVLLGEVEEIISEAQQTGEQILLRANEEAASLRSGATDVMAQAQTEARAIVETARREGEQVLAEQRRLATVRAQEAMREQDRLKDQIRRLEERRRQVLESLEPLISQLTQMMPSAAAPQNVVHLPRQQQPAAKG